MGTEWLGVDKIKINPNEMTQKMVFVFLTHSNNCNVLLTAHALLSFSSLILSGISSLERLELSRIPAEWVYVIHSKIPLRLYRNVSILFDYFVIKITNVSWKVRKDKSSENTNCTVDLRVFNIINNIQILTSFFLFFFCCVRKLGAYILSVAGRNPAW